MQRPQNKAEAEHRSSHAQREQAAKLYPCNCPGRSEQECNSHEANYFEGNSRRNGAQQHTAVV